MATLSIYILDTWLLEEHTKSQVCQDRYFSTNITNELTKSMLLEYTFDTNSSYNFISDNVVTTNENLLCNVSFLSTVSCLIVSCQNDCSAPLTDMRPYFYRPKIPEKTLERHPFHRQYFGARRKEEHLHFVRSRLQKLQSPRYSFENAHGWTTLKVWRVRVRFRATEQFAQAQTRAQTTSIRMSNLRAQIQTTVARQRAHAGTLQ